MRVLRIALLSAALALSTGLLAAPALAGSDLFGRAYLSTSVEKEGEPYDLWKDSRLRVDFRHEGPRRDVVTWRAGCNFYGAGFEVEDEHIITRRIWGTDMGCAPARRERQDRFFVRFFRADPAYVASGDELRLSARDVVIELQRRP